MDYYKELHVERNASAKDIAQAYRLLALRFHPDLCKEDQNTAYRKFCAVAEAYEVLSNEQKRAVYDKHGYQGLKNGQMHENVMVGYAFNGNPEHIFEQFFGSSNPYTQIYGIDCKLDGNSQEEFGSLLNYAYNKHKNELKPKAQNLEIKVECTLEELYNGCQKNITYQRIKLSADKSEESTAEESITIDICRGFSDGQRILYKGQGHETFGQKNSDLVFVLHQKAHPNFRREHNDLIYTQQIDLQDALLSKPISITHLDGRKIFSSVDKVISPQTEIVIQNEGMPVADMNRKDISRAKEPYQHGHLKVQFDIRFPSNMNQEKKSKLVEILS